jgi:hypothetical protein
MSTFEYFTAHPKAGRSFAEAMSGTTHASEDAILAADAFPDFTLAIDIGGSQGSLLRRLLEGNPDATGIVFDLPGVIAGWSVTDDDPLARRISGVGGDFFESVPSGGDLYLLKLILHDWDDARCVEILRRVRDAIKPGGHVVIVESILPATIEPGVGWLRDMNMMVITGGRERTEQAFAQLLDQAGFQLDRVVPTTSHFSVITATASDGETAGA